MIRKAMGEEFWLIPQVEHARLAGEVARRFGNERFARPDLWEETVEAISIHDGGWPLHDEKPTLNKDGLPVDVFETPLDVALRVWEEGVQRAGAKSPYTQLLVSLHVLGLSGYAAENLHTPKEMFTINQFQQRQVERQEELRRKVGLRTDLAVKLGLAAKSQDAGEQRLFFHHMLMQVSDRISLGLCCTELVFPDIEGVPERPGGARVDLMLVRTSPTSLSVTPWPFEEESIELSVACRRVPNRRYSTDKEFQQVFAQSPTGRLAMRIGVKQNL
jgi:hypothetical protein